VFRSIVATHLRIRAVLSAAALIGLACAPSGPRRIELPVFTEDFAIRISTEPMRPYAREPTIFRVVVRDKKTKAPVEKGEGRVFATNRDGISVYDVLDPAPESGTYTARLRFITAGDWALGIQFRRDSTEKLQRADWMQSVLGER
jgi:hypothetical protein